MFNIHCPHVKTATKLIKDIYKQVEVHLVTAIKIGHLIFLIFLEAFLKQGVLEPRDLPASAPQVLRLKAYITMTGQFF